MKKTKITDLEMVAIASGFAVSGLCWEDTYNKVAKLLQNATDYHYAMHTGLVENLMAYAKQRGFADGLQKVGTSYARFIKKTRSARIMNTASCARNMARSENVPREIEIPQID